MQTFVPGLFPTKIYQSVLCRKHLSVPLASTGTYHERHSTRFFAFRGQPASWEATIVWRFIVSCGRPPVPDWHLMALGTALIEWTLSGREATRGDTALTRVDTTFHRGRTSSGGPEVIVIRPCRTTRIYIAPK